MEFPDWFKLKRKHYTHCGISSAATLLVETINSTSLLENEDTRELEQTNAAAANLQISIDKDSRQSEFSRPLTFITLTLNGDLPVDRRRVSLLKLPNNSI